jgi:hypothetical protein
MDFSISSILPMLRLSRTASTNVTRPTCSQIRLFPDGVAVATDGHVLAQATHPFSLTDSVGLESGALLTEAVKELERLARRKGHNGRLEAVWTDTHLTLQTMGLKDPRGLILPISRHEFPRVSLFLDGMSRIGTAQNRIFIDFDLLSQAVSAMSLPGRSRGVVMEWAGEDRPLMLYGPEDTAAQAIIMPIRLADDAPCRRLPPVIDSEEAES